MRSRDRDRDGVLLRRRLWHRPVLLGGSAVVMVAVYFVLPLHFLGAHRAAVSWVAFVVGLGLVAVMLTVQVRNVLTGRAGTGPAWVIVGLMCLTVLLFASAYFVLARQQGEFAGLHTRVDALYFTLITLATIGYGDISPIGQTARVVTMLQVLYSLVFLTAGATTLSRQLLSRIVRRGREAGGRREDD
jgi:NADH:ubiquinone oxidoreductase subunit 6 (subunit J)